MTGCRTTTPGPAAVAAGPAVPQAGWAATACGTAATRADRVVVIGRGSVVESGTHAALPAVRGPYRGLRDVCRQTGASATDDQFAPAAPPHPDPTPDNLVNGRAR